MFYTSVSDRSHGNEFCRQFEESCLKIEDYVSLLEKEIKQRKKVLGFCEGAEDFYSEQYREANIVATVSLHSTQVYLDQIVVLYLKNR